MGDAVMGQSKVTSTSLHNELITNLSTRAHVHEISNNLRSRADRSSTHNHLSEVARLKLSFIAAPQPVFDQPTHVQSWPASTRVP